MTGAPFILDERFEYDDGSFVQLRIRIVPRPVLGSTHSFKYSLVYIRDGMRVIGYDNERTKGDHRHYDDREETYDFTTEERLIADFLAGVTRARGTHEPGNGA